MIRIIKICFLTLYISDPEVAGRLSGVGGTEPGRS